MRHVMHKWIQVGCFRPAGQLILSLFSVALVQCSCAAVPPPPETAEDLGCVKADDFCRHLPTVGRCKRVAARIHNDCLRKCVIEQCTKAMVRCDEFIEQVCRERDKTRPGGGHAAAPGASRIHCVPRPVRRRGWCMSSRTLVVSVTIASHCGRVRCMITECLVMTACCTTVKPDISQSSQHA